MLGVFFGIHVCVCVRARVCVCFSELLGDSGEGTGMNLYHTEPTVQNCTFSSSINRPKDV